MNAGGEAPTLRRFERDAVAACLVMAVVAFVAVAPLRGMTAALRAALGVLGGGLLMGVSYRAIKGAADLLVEIAVGRGAAEPSRPSAAADRAGGDQPPDEEAHPAAPAVLSFGRRAFLAVKFFTRYALLAVAAYVMLTCFRLHPVGVLAGATSPFIAAALQAAREWRAGSQRPRQ